MKSLILRVVLLMILFGTASSPLLAQSRRDRDRDRADVFRRGSDPRDSDRDSDSDKDSDKDSDNDSDSDNGDRLRRGESARGGRDSNRSRSHEEVDRTLERAHGEWHRRNDGQRRDARWEREHDRVHDRLDRVHDENHRRAGTRTHDIGNHGVIDRVRRVVLGRN